MIASISGSAKIASNEGDARPPYFAANFWRFSSEREKQEIIFSLPERLIASASTSDHHPMPMQATRNGAPDIFPPLRPFQPFLLCLFCGISLFPARADRFDRRLRDLFVCRPIVAADPDTADAFSVEDDRIAPFHGGPAFGAGRERQTQRMRDIERLPLRTARRRRALIGSSAHSLGGARMQRVV